METGTIYMLIQITLFLAACWGCWQRGIRHGVSETLRYLEDKEIIKIVDEE